MCHLDRALFKRPENDLMSTPVGLRFLGHGRDRTTSPGCALRPYVYLPTEKSRRETSTLTRRLTDHGRAPDTVGTSETPRRHPREWVLDVHPSNPRVYSWDFVLGGCQSGYEQRTEEGTSDVGRRRSS